MRFFGETTCALRTPSFDFSDMIALVPDREVPRHTHDDAHFVLVVRGTYVTEARNRPGLCGAATLVFNPAGTTHRDRFHTDLGRFFTITVAREVARHIETTHRSAVSLPREVASIAQCAREEFARRTAFSSMILEGLGLELAGRAGLWSLNERTTPPWLLDVRDAIHDRCTSNVTIRELAQIANVHPIHLARAFRRSFRCSPGEYLRRCRIEKLRELLQRDLPLAEVALEAGFSDQSAMTTAFRRATGLTPRAFRRKHNVSCAQEIAAR